MRAGSCQEKKPFKTSNTYLTKKIEEPPGEICHVRRRPNYPVHPNLNPLLHFKKLDPRDPRDPAPLWQMRADLYPPFWRRHKNRSQRLLGCWFRLKRHDRCREEHHDRSESRNHRYEGRAKLKFLYGQRESNPSLLRSSLADSKLGSYCHVCPSASLTNCVIKDCCVVLPGSVLKNFTCPPYSVVGSENGVAVIVRQSSDNMEVRS